MIDNKERSRFERHIGEHVVFADYTIKDNVLVIRYVEAPPALRGTGESGRLMHEIVEFATAGGFKIFPICSYALSWLNRNPQGRDLLTPAP